MLRGDGVVSTDFVFAEQSSRGGVADRSPSLLSDSLATVAVALSKEVTSIMNSS